MAARFGICAVLIAAPATAQGLEAPAAEPELLLPPPAGQTDAGGRNLPNLGMHQLKKNVDSFLGKLISAPVDLPPGLIPDQDPPPLGRIIDQVDLYLPDLADPEGPIPQFLLDAAISLPLPETYPDALWMANTDPSGSLDESVLDASGEPVHFNLHWPNHGAPEGFWLDEAGYEASAPTDDLDRILKHVLTTGSQDRIPEALDILLGTNVSGALQNRVYRGFPLLRHRGATNKKSFDPVTRNVTVTQLWYGTEIRSDCELLEVPAHGDYTITWKLRGLGDTGPNREFAFPIDEFTSMPMKKTSNGDFWKKNSWIWKWFLIIQPPGSERRYTLESLYEAHTGTDAAPSYSELVPGDPRSWLHADRRFDLGSYVGEGDPFDFSLFHTYDLDLDGRIGGHLVDGTDTGAAWDPDTNPDAQFNQYGNNEYGVPRVDWSGGPMHVPYFAYDSSFTTLRKGQGIDVTIRYSDGEMQAGLYNWGWRVHPPRIHWIETYSEGQILPSGAPKEWRFGHKWDEIEALGLAAVGDHAPEKVIHDALVAYQASGGEAADLAAFAAAVEGMMDHVHDRRGLPPTDDVVDFPDPAADVNFLFTNFDVYADRETVAAPGKRNWGEGDVIKITVHNDDNVERYFRVVDFGTTDYQYNGADMGLLDWKPVFGFPQLAALAWAPPASSVDQGFGSQGFDLNFWTGTELEGLGNPFYVDPGFEDLAGFFPMGERDLVHHFADLSGFSGPGFTSEHSDPFSVWASEPLAGKSTGDGGLWSYSYGKPVPPNTTVTFEVEMPRASALNNGAMYMFDPQFHASAIFTMHPTSQLEVEGLDD